MKNVIYALVACTLILAFIVSGCSNNASTTPAAKTTAPAATTNSPVATTNPPAAATTSASNTPAASRPFAGVQLNVFMTGHDHGIADLLPQFESETGMKVNITTTGMTDLYAKLGTEFAANGSSYDVTEMMWEAAQGYARANYLLVLDEYIKKYKVDMNQYTSVYIKNHMIQYPETAEGKYIALPHQADIQLLAYRADLFGDAAEKADFKAKYGYDLKVPEDYQEFLDAARFFTRDTDNDGTVDLYGTTVMGKNFPSTVGDITPYIHSFGGDWITAEYKPVINSAQSIAGIQYYYDLYAKEKVTPPGAGTYAWDEENADFQNGKIAMMTVWPGSIAALENPAASKVAGKIGYSVVPGKAPTVGGWCLAIPARAKNPEASFQFIRWLTSSDIALKRAQTTGFSTATQALFDDAVMNQKFKYLKAFSDSVQYGLGWPQIGEFTSIWQIGAEEISRLFAGEISVQQSADNMQQRIDKLMRDGGYYK